MSPTYRIRFPWLVEHPGAPASSGRRNVPAYEQGGPALRVFHLRRLRPYIEGGVPLYLAKKPLRLAGKKPGPTREGPFHAIRSPEHPKPYQEDETEKH